ncbi:MAG: MFS transporter, partial [Nitrososphaerota archaeon]|nr:MFS transporter [Nitrososphaerota archaeon]
MSREEFESLIAFTVPMAALYFLISLGGWLWFTLFGKYLIMDLGFSGEELGFVIMAYNLFFAISTFPAGILSDTIESRKILFSGIAICSLGVLIMAFSLSAVTMAIACAIVGIGEGLSFTSITVHTIKSGGVRRIGTLYGFVLWVGSLGEILGSIMSGYVKEYLGSQSLFLLSSAISVSSLPLLALVKERPRRRRSIEPLTNPFRLLRSHNPLRLMTLGLVFHTIGYSMLFPFISVHAGLIGLADREIGIINFAIFSSAFLTTLPWGILTDRIGSKSILVNHVFLSSISWITYALSGDLSSIILAAAFIGVVNSMDLPSRRRLLAETSGKEGIGTLIGTLEFFTMLSSIP